MSTDDGGMFRDNMKKVLVFRCGSVPRPLFSMLIRTLDSFIQKITNIGEKSPAIEIREISEPIIVNIYSDEWVQAFTQISNTLEPNPVRILITSLGLWDNGPRPRMLFAQCILPGTVVFSTLRFGSLNDLIMKQRLSKEMVKVLGMAFQMDHCSIPGCIMEYHCIPEDLDRTTGMCPTCQMRCNELVQQVVIYK